MMEPSPRRQPSDNLEELQTQLLQELGRLEENRTEEPDLFRAYVQHAQVRAWRGVADGHMDAPREALECLRRAQPFLDRNMPHLAATAAAAVEVYHATQSLSLAAEALAKRRAEDRISGDRSETERALLRILARNRSTYLRRGEIHTRLSAEDRPTPARIGQILAELYEEGIVLRIHGRAQGNANAAFYALSPRGVELCRNLSLSDEESDRDRLPPPILKAIEAACNPSLNWERRSVARGVLATEGLGPRKNAILKALLAKTESHPEVRVQVLVDEVFQRVVRAPLVQARGVTDSKILFSQKPEEQPQPAEVAFAYQGEV